MTSATTPSRRTLTLRASSGKTVLAVPLVPAAAAGVLALAVAPRITALAVLAALLRKMSLSMEAAPAPRATV